MNRHVGESIGKLLGLAFALVLVAGLGIAVYIGVDRLVEWIATADRSLVLVLIVCITAFMIARTLAKGLVRSRQVGPEERICRRKALIYRHLIRSLPETTNPPGSTEQDLVLWGSPAVIGHYLELRHMDQRGPKHTKALESLLLAMRQDIGSKTGGLSEGDLVALMSRWERDLQLTNRRDGVS